MGVGCLDILRVGEKTPIRVLLRPLHFDGAGTLVRSAKSARRAVCDIKDQHRRTQPRILARLRLTPKPFFLGFPPRFAIIDHDRHRRGRRRGDDWRGDNRRRHRR